MLAMTGANVDCHANATFDKVAFARNDDSYRHTAGLKKLISMARNILQDVHLWADFF